MSSRVSSFFLISIQIFLGKLEALIGDVTTTILMVWTVKDQSWNGECMECQYGLYLKAYNGHFQWLVQPVLWEI